MRSRWLFPALLVLMLGAGAPRAAADEAPALHEPHARGRRAPHALYLELLGKGGYWGLGYDYQLRPRLAVGGAVSYSVIDQEHLLSLSPYLAAYPVKGRRHAWFFHGGPRLLHLSVPSPVPEWSGKSFTSIGAQLSSGWELRARVLVRCYAMATVGRGGVAPWLGLSVGWTFE